MSDGLTIKERIALLKQKESNAKESKGNETPVKVGKLNIPQQKPSSSTASSTTPQSEIKTGGSIADRIAAMKAKSASEAVKPTGSSPSIASQATGVATASREKFNQGAGTTSDTPSKVETEEKQESEELPKRSSIADRIAAMKSKSANESLPPAIGAKPTPNKFPISGATPPAPAPSSSSNNSKPGNNSCAQAPDSEEATPKRMSIAERLAALQSAEKADEDKHKKEEEHGAQRRLTSDKLAFAQQLNLGGLVHPGGVRPMPHVPGHRIPGQVMPGMAVNEDDVDTRGSIISLDGSTSRRNSTSTDGDIRHMSLSRPTIHSVRKSRAHSRLSAYDFSEEGIDIKQMLEEQTIATGGEVTISLGTVEEMDVADKETSADTAMDEG